MKKERVKLDGQLEANTKTIKAKLKALPTIAVIHAPLGQKAQPLANILWVDREDLTANLYNPNSVAPHELELLKVSILEDGWTQPIVGFQVGKKTKGKGWLCIIDGFHRWTLSEDPQIFSLTDGMVPVVVVTGKSVSDRMMSTVRHNRARGRHGVEHMANMVRYLVETEGLKPEDLVERLGMEMEEVERLLIHTGMPAKVTKEGHVFGKAWKPVARTKE